MSEQNSNNAEHLVDLVVEGLLTEGESQKQYFLEQILETLVGDADHVARLNEVVDWESGEAPE